MDAIVNILRTPIQQASNKMKFYCDVGTYIMEV